MSWKHWGSIVLILIALVPTGAQSDQALEPFEQEFKMTMSGFRVTAIRSLSQLENGDYELRLRARNMVARYEEKSIFRLDGLGQILPLQHSVNSRVFGVSRRESTEFDWESGEARYVKGDTERAVAIQPGLLDRATYQLLITEDLQSGATEMQYEFVDRGRLKNYRFAILDEESIELADTSVMAVRMQRINEEDPDKETNIWFASDHNYKLVKISHIDQDGSDYHMVLKGEL